MISKVTEISGSSPHCRDFYKSTFSNPYHIIILRQPWPTRGPSTVSENIAILEQNRLDLR
jgi:hypothetical protein